MKVMDSLQKQSTCKSSAISARQTCMHAHISDAAPDPPFQPHTPTKAAQPSILRLKAVQYTHLIAEYFRDQGKNVLLLVDSLTRVAHAQREIGLAVGEPPTAKGYPPSVFTLIPNLIERAGVGRYGHGAITAVYTVLAEGDDANDPIVDIARASLDGQVMLSRELADAAHSGHARLRVAHGPRL